MLSRLPADLTGLRVLDAGCGTGAMAVEAGAARGARWSAVDISPGADRHRARARCRPSMAGSVDCARRHAGPALGRFDHVVAMDSLIHYRAADIVAALDRLAARTRGRSSSLSRRARRC